MDRSTTRIPVTIPVYPHYMDHRFAGGIVFPAVEALKVLAGSVAKSRFSMPHPLPWHMVDARFNKFLFLAPGQKTFDAFSDIRPIDDSRLSMTLGTRTAIKNKTMTRVKEHCTVTFSSDAEPDIPAPFRDVHGLHGTVFTVPADRIYKELVPFGPAFHSITGQMRLSRAGAAVSLNACPDHPDDPLKTVLGSGFPLDGAFHAGCAWSQRFFGIVAFPVGFDKRIIYQKTIEHCKYAARVIPTGQTDGTLGFDIWIIDETGTLCETIFGVRMRDVSGGAIRPPAWIMEAPL